MEVSGTSRIEGADFAANELEVAMKAEIVLFLKSYKSWHGRDHMTTYTEFKKECDLDYDARRHGTACRA
jgi:hypothetical protein